MSQAPHRSHDNLAEPSVIPSTITDCVVRICGCTARLGFATGGGTRYGKFHLSYYTEGTDVDVYFPDFLFGPRRRNKWSQDAMIMAVNAVRERRMGLRKAGLLFSVPKTTLQRFVKKGLPPELCVVKKFGGRGN